MKRKFWDEYNPVAFAVVIFFILVMLIFMTLLPPANSMDFDKMTYYKNKDGLCFGVGYKSTQIVYIPCNDIKIIPLNPLVDSTFDSKQ